MRVAFMCALALLSAACHDPNAYTLGPSQIDEILRVSLSATTAQADGISRVTITVQLDPATDVDKRTLSVATTAGTLIASGSEGSTVLIQADATGQAFADLRSSTTPGTARIDVSVAGITRTQTVQFTPVAAADLFDVTVARPSIPADGFSTSRITVLLKRLGTPPQRAVRIETSAGVLVASGMVASRQVTVTADASGLAAVDLQSEKTIGTARVRVTALDAGRDVEVRFTNVNPTDIITIVQPRSLTPADGVTTASVTAVVASGLPAPRRTVTFRTTLGFFQPGRTGEFSIEADGRDTARADLASLVAGTAHVTATVDGSTADAFIEFLPALPDRILLSVGGATLRSGGTVTVTATLIRSIGTVSPRLPVTFSAATDQQAAIGAFIGTPLAENGVASVTFNLGTTLYVGGVLIRADVEGAANASRRIDVLP